MALTTIDVSASFVQLARSPRLNADCIERDGKARGVRGEVPDRSFHCARGCAPSPAASDRRRLHRIAGIRLRPLLGVKTCKRKATSDRVRSLPIFFCIALLLLLVPPAGADDQKLSSVRIGYQKYGTLNIVKAEGSFEKSLAARGINVTWILFSAGPQLLEALNAGSIDLGNAGEAPPIFAQAAGVNLVYFGNQPPFPKGEGILVKKDSPIQKVSDLKAKRIALNKGSNVHFFLVKLLEKTGLKMDEITPVYLTPADAWAALEGGSVDAWVIWDPFMTAAIERSGARILQDAEGIAANREFFLADRRFAQAHQEILLAIQDAVNRCGTWVTTKPEEVVHYLAPQLGMSEDVVSKVIRAQPWGFQPISDQVVSDQQTIGDTFFGLKLIPKTIHVADAVVRIQD
jgi:sulfonate transport system substrate-binding protein